MAVHDINKVGEVNERSECETDAGEKFFRGGVTISDNAKLNSKCSQFYSLFAIAGLNIK